MKRYFDIACGAVIACLIASFFTSMFRLATTPGTYCEPKMIDKLEPLLSTRWFCSAEKS